ncbi:MAG TPA: hypothetical protein VGT44_09570 [Ktedonobacteraceae bacterium]|nr:hypothetical protein [Ktedonobacteraceae bacterium]
MKNKRKLLLSLIVMMSLLVNLAIVFGIFDKLLPSFAQSPGVTVTDFYIASGQDPWGTTFDSKGNVWVAVPGCDPSPMCNTNTPPGKIEVYDPSTKNWTATYQLPSGYGQPLFIQFDASGNLWFAMPMSNSIGMFDPQSDTFQQYAVPTAGSGPWGLAIDHNGNIWFTEHYTDQIGEFIPSTQTMKEFVTPTANSLPYGITVDASDNIWFAENNSAVAQIGEYTAGGKMEEYKIRSNPPSGLTPHMITVDPNGNIWWTEGWVGMIGELDVTKATPGTNNGVTEYAYPISCNTCGEHTSGIKVDGYDQVWFDDSMQGIFGSFPDSGTGSFSTYPAPTQQHPHDGLNVDAQNRIWFTEEFANKLAEAIQNGPPPTPTPSPSPSPSPTKTIARDTFKRANQQFWGKASDGLTWGGDANSSSVFSINNKKGQLSNGATAYNAVLGPVVTDSEVIFRGSLSSFKSANIGAVLRWTDTDDWYDVYIDGSSLVLQKDVSGVTSTLKTVAFAAAAGKSYLIDFKIVGTTLSANVWKAGTTEPSGWMVTTNDSSLSSGYCGLRIQLQGSVVATIASFQAWS